MTDGGKKGWDDIPSLNLELDADYGDKLKESAEARRHSRTRLALLNKVLYERIDTLPVKVATARKGVAEGSILDLSRSGVRVAVPILLEKGEPTKVGFVLNKRQVVARAVVQWVVPREGGGCEAGMEFAGLAADLSVFLEGLVAADQLNKIR